MTVRDTIVTINGVEPGLVQAALQHGKEMNITIQGIVLVDRNYANEVASRPIDTTGVFKEIVCDFDSPDELQRAIKPYADRLLAVTCRFESAITAFRKVIPFLPNIHRPTESALLWSSDKSLMRNRLSNYDETLTPKYQYMESKDMPNVQNLLRDFTYPVIVKPTGLASSLLVTECATEKEMLTCLAYTFKVIGHIYAKEHRRTKPGVLIEEMMQGEMYSTDAYIDSKGEISCLPLVRVITAKEAGLTDFYGYRCIVPTGLPDHDVQAAFTIAKAAIKAVNLNSSTAHVELFRTPTGWKIIELGARIGGYRESLYKEAYGIDHYYNDLAVRMDKKLKMPGTAIGNAACLNLYAEQEGTIASIDGIKEAQKLESVVYINTHSKPGNQAMFARNGGRLIIDSILSNQNAVQLERDVQELERLVKITVIPNRPIFKFRFGQKKTHASIQQ